MTETQTTLPLNLYDWISGHGPKLPFISVNHCRSAVRQTGLSLQVQTVWTMKFSYADRVDVRFRHFDGAAFFSDRSTFFAALQPMSPNRPLKANLRCEIQSTLLPQAASRMRISWIYAHAAFAETARCLWDSLYQIPFVDKLGGRPNLQIAHRQSSRSRKRLIATGSFTLFYDANHLGASRRSD